MTAIGRSAPAVAVLAKWTVDEQQLGVARRPSRGPRPSPARHSTGITSHTINITENVHSFFHQGENYDIHSLLICRCYIHTSKSQRTKCRRQTSSTSCGRHNAVG